MTRRKRIVKRVKQGVSIPVIPTAYMAWVAGTALEGVSFDGGLGSLKTPFENLRANAKELAIGGVLALGGTILARQTRNLSTGIKGFRLRLA